MANVSDDAPKLSWSCIVAEPRILNEIGLRYKTKNEQWLHVLITGRDIAGIAVLNGVRDGCIRYITASRP